MDFGIRSMARLERCISLTPIHPARSYSRKHRQACAGVWNLDYEQQQMYLTLDEESETSESKSSQLPETEQLDLAFQSSRVIGDSNICKLYIGTY